MEIEPKWRTDGLGLRGTPNRSVDNQQPLSFESAHVVASNITGQVDQVPVESPLDMPKPIGKPLPWIGSTIDDDGESYDGWFGADGNGDFISNPAAALKKFDIAVVDEDDPSASTMNLTVGDSTPDNDGLQFTYDSEWFLQLNWTTETELLMTDTGSNDPAGGNGIDIHLDSTNSNAPVVLLTDPDGQFARMDIVEGPLIELSDSGGADITIDISGMPEITLDDGADAKISLDLLDQPRLLMNAEDGSYQDFYFSDGPTWLMIDSESQTIDVNLRGSGPQILMSGASSQSIQLDINDHPEIILTDADSNTISLDFEGGPEISISYSDGSLSNMDMNSLYLYDASSGGSVTIDASAIEGGAASFQQIQVCDEDGNVATMYVLGTEPE